MTKLTRSGIAYDLSISPHKTEILYSGRVITYIFSSELYMNKFEEKIVSNRNKINESLSNRFRMDINASLIADLKLYSEIEKRGFLIKTEKESHLCLNTIKLDGLMLMMNS